ncbi:unnamed protein product [Mucor circinelloides]|uniref:SbsA Ig-like domain-containing protein n=1 Tax=Mucor circinelloides f. circinelloides (strain 1006PhL) TaxID=1220926 RepID=S2JF68_MUCC1|nr:hypothetical protein HMPREF1544_04276 [Mucor circinelloides 1006PhL]
MKLQILVTVLLACLFSMVSSISIPYDTLDDFEIAKLYVAELNSAAPVTDNSQGKIVFPTPNTTWYVGERVNVTFDEGVPDETVSIFFFNKTDTLAGGPMNRTSFPFTVPPSAVSVPENGTSLLLAVRRQNRYLQTVDSVVVHVVARAP